MMDWSFAALVILTLAGSFWSLRSAQLEAVAAQGTCALAVVALAWLARLWRPEQTFEAALGCAYGSTLIGLWFATAPAFLLVGTAVLLPLLAAARGVAAWARWTGLVTATWLAVALGSTAWGSKTVAVTGLLLLAAGSTVGWAWAAERKQQRRRVEDLQSSARDSERAMLAANEKRSEFVTNMSHEFRTPLAGILGLSELLLKGPFNAEQQKHLHLLQDSTRGLLAMVDDLLDVGRVESGNLRLVKRRVAITKLCERTVGFLAPRAVAKGLELRCELDPKLPKYLAADQDRIRQILLNLLANAIKFTEKGEVELEVTWSGAPSSVRFEIRDTGIGIPEAAIPRLFAPFQQVDSSTSRRFGGTGLGLAISKSLVDLMGGEIGVESRRGHGSTFWFEVPLAIYDDEESSDGSEVDVSGRLKGHRILVVEDDEVNLLVIVAKLESMGVEVETARHGAQALDLLAAQRFDLVLMDCQIPGIDGYEATRRLRRASGPQAQVPVVALTAHTHPEERGRCLAAGMNDYLSKPVDIEVLFATLTAWLEAGPLMRGVASRDGGERSPMETPP